MLNQLKAFFFHKEMPVLDLFAPTSLILSAQKPQQHRWKGLRIPVLI